MRHFFPIVLTFAAAAFASGQDERVVTTPLLEAVYVEDEEKVSQLLLDGADPNQENFFEAQPIQYACQNGNVPILQALLKAGAKPDAIGEGGIRPLMIAAANGNAELVETLLEAGADPLAKDRRGQAAIHFACAEGNTAAVKILVKNGADPLDRIERGGFDGFLLACRNGHTELVAQLLKNGAEPNRRIEKSGGGRDPRKGTSAMRLAMESAHFETAALLLKAGADPRDDTDGFTPLHALTWIRKSCRSDNIASLPPPTPRGKIGSLEFARLLIEAGANVNSQLKPGVNRAGGKGLRYEGSTPFLMAARTADLPFMKFLIEQKADTKLANAGGQTPLLAAAGVDLGPESDEEATLDESFDAVKFLLENGADVHAIDKKKNNAMHAAAYKQAPRIVKLLAEHGADVAKWNQPNRSGSTPHRIAFGFRPGNFKPSAETAAALSEVMRAAGVTPPEPPPPNLAKEKKSY